jgi:lysozyme
MAGYRIPGPLCVTRSEPIDEGTSCLWRTPAPGPVCAASSLPGGGPVRAARAMSLPGGFSPVLLTLSPEALKLLKVVEELHLVPYDDQTGKDISAWVPGATIGYGHLVAQPNWDDFKDGITAAAADNLFLADLAPFEAAVGASIQVGLQQYEFDALVILAFNIGSGSFKGSSVAKLVNDPKAVTGYPNLEAAWKAWNKSQGQVMKGLDNRRHCEWRIYTAARYERW